MLWKFSEYIYHKYLDTKRPMLSGFQGALQRIALFDTQMWVLSYAWPGEWIISEKHEGTQVNTSSFHETLVEWANRTGFIRLLPLSHLTPS